MPPKGFIRPGSVQKRSLGIAYDVEVDATKGALESQSAAFVRNAYDPSERLSIDQRRRRLPIYHRRTEILYLLEHHSTVVIIGETGSGKTTQLPQYLREAGWAAGGRCIVCTQPRRIAVMAVAQRAAEEVGCQLGHEVGYAIRFEDVSTEGLTQLRFVTDGVLLQELLRDPFLSRYSVVVIDEAHERSLATDLLLGLLRRLQRRRPDLRIVVSSATIEATRFVEFFSQPWGPGRPPKGWREEEGAREGRGSRWDETEGGKGGRWSVHGQPAVLSVEGRLHDVQVHYLRESASDYVRAAVETAIKVHKVDVPGDILIFLTGQEECERAVSMLREEARGAGGSFQLEAMPLYAGLPPHLQLACLEPARTGHRKVVVATNVAETSITLEGVVTVIDCCFSKQRVYDPLAGLESLVVVPVSKQSAAQRAGRAGRVRPGECFRLCTEEDFLALPAADVPEVQRSELSGAVLQLKMLGVDNLVKFPWLSAPPAEAMVRAMESLFSLGAISEDTSLTSPDGLRMAELPVASAMARSLLWAAEKGCADEMCTIAAALSVPSLFASVRGGPKAQEESKARFWVAEGDMITALNVYQAWEAAGRAPKFAHRTGVSHKALLRASDIRGQIRRHMVRLGLSVAEEDASVDTICKGIAAGFFANAAVLQAEGASDPTDTAGPAYRLVRCSTVVAGRPPPLLRVHKSSVLFRCKPEWVVFTNATQTFPGVYEMQNVCAIDSKWLPELAPHFFEVRTVQQK